MKKMSDDPRGMDTARFASLSSTYGSRLHRWPEAEQAQGLVFAETEEGKALLGQAEALDALLDVYTVPSPDVALRTRVLREGKAKSALRRRMWLWGAGFGLTGVGLAGALAGVVVAVVIAPPPEPERYIFDANATAFGEVPTARAIAGEEL